MLAPEPGGGGADQEVEEVRKRCAEGEGEPAGPRREEGKPPAVPFPSGFPAGLRGHSNGENGDIWPMNSDTRFFVFPC